MPITICDKRYLLRLLGFKVSSAELARNIGNMGLNVKRMEGNEIEIEFNADRPDVISTVGLARALRYFMRRSRRFDYPVGPEEKGFTVSVGSHVSRIRPYIAAIVVRNLRLGEADLKDMINFTDKLSETYGRKRAKIAIGLHDLRGVKPPFSYDAYDDEEFVPLNGRRMSYSRVLRTEEKGKAYGSLLGSSKRRYVALKDSVGTMALVPIINAERTKVTRSTREMMVDITGTSRHVIGKIADMLAANFMDMGCDVHRVRIEYADGSAESLPKMEARTISVPLEQINREIGVAVGFNNVILLANKMGHSAALLGRKIRFRVPAYRLDVINDQDLVEDIAIAYGYDYIQPMPVATAVPGSLEGNTVAMRQMGEAMVGLGFSEEMGSYLTNAETNFRNMRIKEEGAVKLANPKTAIATMFRSWLTPSLLRDLSLSAHDRLPQRIFEIDMVFGLSGGSALESYRLAAAVCDAQANFNQMKAVLEGFMRKMRIEFGVRKAEHRSFIEGRCAEITVKGRNVGFLGEIHPEVLANFGIEEPVLAMEIDLSKVTL
jgi:phenylalanyl-tRNA synthetase beta chain